MSESDANKSHAETDAKAEHETKEIGQPRRKLFLSALVYICATFVVIGGLWLGYLGVSGSLHSQRRLALWVLRGTLFFVFAGAVLYFYQNRRRVERVDGKRPMIGVKSLELPYLVPGEKMLVVVHMKNTGGDIANRIINRNALLAAGARTNSDPCPDLPNNMRFAGPFSDGSIPNDGTFDLRVDSWEPINAAQVKQIIDGKVWILVYFIVKYEGRDGASYSTEYYARYVHGAGYVICDSRNHAT